MATSYVDVFTSSPLQCGYRSKVCTNPRATKINGTPHKLCELHRRKANLSQKRLHERHRDERAKRQRCEVEQRSAKRVCGVVSYPIDIDMNTIDPIPFNATKPQFDFGADQLYPRTFVARKLTSGNMNTSMAGLLIQPHHLKPQDKLSPASVIDTSSIIV